MEMVIITLCKVNQSPNNKIHTFFPYLKYLRRNILLEEKGEEMRMIVWKILKYIALCRKSHKKNSLEAAE
jgi:hypothetical protein